MPRGGTVSRTLRAGVALLALAAAIAPAWAAPRSSGGYGRPSMGITRPTPRTPSPSAFAPSGSGGFFRPRDRTPSGLAPSTSAGDMAITRRNSSEALDALRRRQFEAREAAERAARESRERSSVFRERERTPEPASRPRRQEGYQADPSPWIAPAPPRRRADDDARGRNPGYDVDYRPTPRRTPPPRPRWAGDPSWSAPSWVNPGVNAGAWNPILLWYLLDTLSRPGHAEWFRQHRDDPGYASWRRSADAEAAASPALQGKLSELDASLGAPLSGPQDAAYLPPDVNPSEARLASGGGGWFLGLLGTLLLLGLLVAGGIWLMRTLTRRSKTVAGTGIGRVTAAAEGVVRARIGKEEPGRADPFRVGQPVRIDAAPFILGEDVLLAKEPPAGPMSVAGIGRIEGFPLTRLHLGDGRFLQVHLSESGLVDECRLFQLLERVHPDGPDGWAFWLPPGLPSAEEGMGNDWAIGFPIFETKDGTRWDRVWSPGPNQVEPIEGTERIETVSGAKERGLSLMLYARDTEAAAPAPTREYLLLTAVREDGSAEVWIHLGVDVSPAALEPNA